MVGRGTSLCRRGPQQDAGESGATLCAQPEHTPGSGGLGWACGRASPCSGSLLYCNAARRAAKLCRVAGLGKSHQSQK